jgi:hypothetical protein
MKMESATFGPGDRRSMLDDLIDRVRLSVIGRFERSRRAT